MKISTLIPVQLIMCARIGHIFIILRGGDSTTVSMANGSTIQCKGRGKVVEQFVNNTGDQRSLAANDVLHVPGIEMTIL